MPRRPAKDDPALRRAYLEAYASRDARQRVTRIHTRLRIRQETVDHWMKDETFRAEMDSIDDRRMRDALKVAATAWPAIVEEQTRLASGAPETPPDLEGLTPRQFALLRGAYNARAAKRVSMSTRAAELIADLLGARRKEPASVVYNRVDTFGGLPEDLRGLVKENERMDRVLARAKEVLKLEDSRTDDE